MSNTSGANGNSYQLNMGSGSFVQSVADKRYRFVFIFPTGGNRPIIDISTGTESGQTPVNVITGVDLWSSASQDITLTTPWMTASGSGAFCRITVNGKNASSTGYQAYIFFAQIEEAQVFTGPSQIPTSSLQLQETGGGTDVITVQAPAAVTSSYTLTLPSAAPAGNNFTLLCSTAGILSFGGAASYVENPTIYGTVTDPTLANVTLHRLYYVVIGKLMHVAYVLNKTAGGTNGSGTYGVDLSGTGYTVDNTAHGITAETINSTTGTGMIHSPGVTFSQGLANLQNNNRMWILNISTGTAWGSGYVPMSSVIQNRFIATLIIQ
jgi:hypothetical protein